MNEEFEDKHEIPNNSYHKNSLVYRLSAVAVADFFLGRGSLTSSKTNNRSVISKLYSLPSSRGFYIQHVTIT